MYTVPNGKPGVAAGIMAQPRELFAANRSFAQFVAGPVTIDGRLSGNPLNAPYTWVLTAGTLLGRVAATGKYATAVVGRTTAPYGHAGGTATTVQTDAATAAEIVRRSGSTGTLKLTGPATTGGTVATQALAYTAVNTTTGAVTLAAAGTADAVTGSFLQPVDGSEAVVTLLCDSWGVSLADPTGGIRTDVQGGLLLVAGGTVDVTAIGNYPLDPALRTWLKAAIRAACPGVNFSDDFA